MAILLDTGDIEQIRRFMKLGIIRGVTTNPTILRRDGFQGGLEELQACQVKIAEIIKPYPLSVEVTSNDPEEMLTQARKFAGWAENINVKIPIHGPEGELDNLEVVHRLETEDDIRVNVTAMMSAQQGLLAALAGASYVSLFGGRISDIGHDAGEEFSRLRNLIDSLDLKAKIIAGSVREVANVADWLEAGADFVTVPPALLAKMPLHPYSKETVRMFLQDAGKSGGSVNSKR
jgi:transaldolase